MSNKWKYKRAEFPVELIVEQDTREHQPLLFPSTLDVWFGNRKKRLTVKVEKVKLDAGDYRVKEFGHVVTCERKGSARELYSNLLSKDSRRQARAFKKLAESAEYAYLLVEAGPWELLCRAQHCPDPARMVQRLGVAISRYGLLPLFVGKSTNIRCRRKVGEFLLDIFVGHLLDNFA